MHKKTGTTHVMVVCRLVCRTVIFLPTSFCISIVRSSSTTSGVGDKINACALTDKNEELTELFIIPPVISLSHPATVFYASAILIDFGYRFRSFDVHTIVSFLKLENHRHGDSYDVLETFLLSC